jgi:hypothetical protein
MEPATLAGIVATLFFSEALKEGKKSGQKRLGPRYNLSHFDLKGERIASGM